MPFPARKELEETFEDDEEFEDDDDDYLNMNEDEGGSVPCSENSLDLMAALRRRLGRRVCLHGGARKGGRKTPRWVCTRC